MKKELLYKQHKTQEKAIKIKLEEFRKLPVKEQYYEFIFCMLTPQSNARKCWEAVEQIKNMKKYEKEEIIKILKSKTRFHNNKSRYILAAPETWKKVQIELTKREGKDLRDWIAENVNGYGLKEAGHFMRNIGKSANKIAILDRHILRNLEELGVISQQEIALKNASQYYKVEEKMLQFSQEIGIPIDELDLVFWSNETGTIFK